MGLSGLERKQILNRYQSLLCDDVVPFWLAHGIDWEHGGVLSCLNDDGSVASGDKYIWSQARAVWTYSALYNRIEARPEFLKVAENAARFLLAHGRDADGRWVYLTDQEGRVLEGATSIYSDCFAVYGLSEYYRATKDEAALAVACDTLKHVSCRVEEPDFCDTIPYPMPVGWKNHGVPMILTEVTNELAQTTGDRSIELLAQNYAARVMDHFVRNDKKVVLEFLTNDYQQLPPPAGTFVMPGHAIESMWFVMHVARRHDDRETLRRAAEVIRWHLELGWDPQYGGLMLSRDIEGNDPYLPHSDKKLWWPHVEALYATLLADRLTGEEWCLEWHEKISQWTWSHFPNVQDGEWYQRLNRQGEVSNEVIALPVKDPFHLPRAAILIVQLMRE